MPSIMTVPAGEPPEMDHKLYMLLSSLSWVMGISYFAAWSLSFYPQIIMNTRRQSTSGFSINYALINVVGFLAYTLNTAMFLFSPVVKDEYAARHPQAPHSTFRAVDFVYAAHAFVVCVYTLGQFWYYEGRAMGMKSVVRGISLLGVAIMFACFVWFVVVLGLAGRDRDAGVWVGRGWGWIDVAYVLGHTKTILTALKYIPQAYMNYVRQSTVGWSIGVILLDLAGSILSILQLIIDSSVQRDWSGVTGNPIKFGIANVTFIFDIVFIVQHYCIYGSSKTEQDESNSEDANERTPLLN